ncbi:hypothetical protein I547_7591 [Mycobacterium kansasii 824]|nr:hypothetical protein I547_7591 [Mycobacterium kansasii 824]
MRPGRDGKAGITARSLRVLATDSRTIIAELLTRQPGVPVRGRAASSDTYCVTA